MSNYHHDWRDVTRGQPCEVCGRTSWCARDARDPDVVLCRGADLAPPGWVRVGKETPVFVREGHPSLERAPDPRSPEERERLERERIAKERAVLGRVDRLWDGALDRSRGDLGLLGAYMAARGVHVDLGGLSYCLRVDPEAEFGYSGTRGWVELAPGPAILARTIDRQGDMRGVQRIYLDPRQPTRKREEPDHPDAASKQMLGPVQGAWVPIGEFAPVGVLILAEGVETAIAVHAAVGDAAAVWAVLSTAGLETFDPPPEAFAPAGPVQTVIIAADHDRIDARRGVRPGLASARRCAQAIAERWPDVEVRIALPLPSHAPTLFAGDAEADGYRNARRGKSVDWLDVVAEVGPEKASVLLLQGKGAKLDGAGAASGGGGGGRGGRGGGRYDARGVAMSDNGRPLLPPQRVARGMVVLNDLFAPPIAERPGSCWLLRNYQGRVYVHRPDLGAWWPLPNDEVLTAVIARAFHDYDVAGPGDADEPRHKRFTSASATVRDIQLATLDLISVTGVDLPCWLEPDYDDAGRPVRLEGMAIAPRVSTGPIPPHRVSAWANGLFDATAWARGQSVRTCMHPPTPRWFSPHCLPSELPLDVLEAWDAIEDESDRDQAEQDWYAQHCPLWINFLGETFAHDAEAIEALARFVGYTFHADQSLESMLWIQGDKGSGKGTIREVWTEVIGENAVVAVKVDDLAHRFGLGAMVGRQIAFMPELEIGPKTDRASALGTLKMITGGDPVRVEEKYETVRCDTRLTARIVITPNTTPRFSDDSAALMRRLVVLVTQPRAGKTADRGLKARLKDEAEAIRVWAIAAYRRMRIALDAGLDPFPRPAQSEHIRRDIEISMSPLRAFLDDRCVVGAGNECPTKIMYECFEAWAHEEGVRHISTASQFGSSLISAAPGVVKVQRRTQGGAREYVYDGIRPVASLDGDDGRAQAVTHKPRWAEPAQQTASYGSADTLDGLV